MVLYFSGTGNSRYIARRIADATNNDIYSINTAIRENLLFDNTNINKLIFVLPTYAWRIPRIVEDWIRKSKFALNPDVYFVMNCGGEIGNAEKYIRNLTKEMNFNYMGCAEIVMPENYLAMFSTPNREQSERIIRKREPQIDDLSESIRDNKKLPCHTTNLTGKIMSGFINSLFYPLCVNTKKFKVKGDCIGCGKCATQCPLNNIKIKAGNPVWGNQCTHCMACITACPTEAIEYGKKSIGKNRYRCPYK